MPPALWEKFTFPFHLPVRTLRMFFAKPSKSMLEERKFGESVGPGGKAEERDREC